MMTQIKINEFIKNSFAYMETNKEVQAVDIRVDHTNPIITPILDACNTLRWIGIKDSKIVLKFNGSEVTVIKKTMGYNNVKYSARIFYLNSHYTFEMYDANILAISIDLLLNV